MLPMFNIGGDGDRDGDGNGRGGGDGDNSNDGDIDNGDDVYRATDGGVG